ncbi:unnamed protein product [Adineta steineri]|uniref:HTH OST-type domain-containing protein n=1 Tax=Adineta steineri TaxID=433720 RepID=A0A814M9H9_9BILA|nr:unnamed protein product [Adineta steineri]CAF1511109.1 unnamed protein product [Adineta steineri]
MRDNEKQKLYETIKQEIRSLLISSPKTKYGGLTGSLLYYDYKQLNCGNEIPYKELGFHSVLSLLNSMPDVVQIEFKENSTSYRIHPVYDKTTAHIQKMVLEQRDKYEYENQIPFHRNNNYSLQRSFDPQQFSQFNKPNIESTYEPYFLFTPIPPLDYEQINIQSNNELSQKRLTLNNDPDGCSTPKTFIETPIHFDIDDYRLNESIQDISSNKTNTSPIDNPFSTHDEPLLPTTSINIISNNEINSQIEEISSISSESDKNVLPPIIDEHRSNNSQCISTSSPSIADEENILTDNEISFNIDQCIECKSDELIKRIHNAVRQCISFRYIHRLCQIKFEYRYYPLTNEILSIKSQLEYVALNEYEKELEEYEKLFQLNTLIDDDICQTMFNEYVFLQRNYYYMKKLMKKKQ